MPNTIRIRFDEVWEHLTLPNIGNCIIQFQMSTLGTTIGHQNLPFRPGFPQETFWIIPQNMLACGVSYLFCIELPVDLRISRRRPLA